MPRAHRFIVRYRSRTGEHNLIADTSDPESLFAGKTSAVDVMHAFERFWGEKVVYVIAEPVK